MSAPDGSAETRFVRFATFAAVPLCLLNMFIQVRFALSGDKGWLMFAADEWVGGKKLETDIVEVNPPLIVWLYGIPAWLSTKFSFLLDYQWLGVMGIVALLIVVLMSRVLIARHPAFREDAQKRREMLLLILAMLLFIVSPVYFTDREHIMLMYTFPYVLRFMPSIAREKFPLPLRVGIGLLAGIGFSIKPHALLIFAALQAVYMVRERSPAILASVENIVIYCFGACYLSAVIVFAPKYLTDVVPMVAAVYSSYNIKGTLHFYLPMAFLATIIPLLDFRPRYTTPYRPEIYYLMCLTAFYFGYALINNGWGYTYQPFFCTLTFLTGWLLWDYDWLKREHLTRGLPYKQFDIGLKGCVYCLALNFIYGIFLLHSLLVQTDCGGYFGCAVNDAYVKAIADKHIKSFGVMSGEFTRWPLISRASGAAWDTRFNHLWMIPGLMHAKEEEATSPRWADDQWIITYVGKAFVDDFTRRKPQAMFIDNSDEYFTYPHHVDILALLNQVPEFKAIWKKHYRFDSTINHCKSVDPTSGSTVGCRYDVYLWKN